MVGSVSNAAPSLSQAQLGNEIATSVMKKTLDASKAQGEAAIKLLDSAVQVQEASVRRAVSEPFKGTLIDVTA